MKDIKNSRSKPRIVDYAGLTTQDRNPIKRRLQNLRLKHSLKMLTENEQKDFAGNILDFGTGNAELPKRINLLFPQARIYGYEPTSGYRRQALSNVEGREKIRIIANLSELNNQQFDYIFCLEVFEHLTNDDISKALDWFIRLILPHGKIIIGVPIEIFLAALVKGIFRMTRRYGEIDSQPKNILKALMGRPPQPREIIEIDSGLPYISRHIGFDYRKLEIQLKEKFVILQTYGSPITWFPDPVNFEKYYICQKI